MGGLGGRGPLEAALTPSQGGASAAILTWAVPHFVLTSRAAVSVSGASSVRPDFHSES